MTELEQIEEALERCAGVGTKGAYEAVRDALALLRSLQQTHVLVPKEPTEKMLVAGKAVPDGIDDVWLTPTRPTPDEIYRAMLAARPQARKETP